MAKVKVWKGGIFHEVEEEIASHYLSRGFTYSPDESVLPELDLSPFDNAQLLHIASIANLIVPADADRAAIETLLKSAWEGLGHPTGWLQNCLDAPAPVKPEDFEVSPVRDEEGDTPVAVEDFDASLTTDDDA